MFIAVLVRRLKPGKTYRDFVEAWYPDKGFGVGTTGPVVACNVHDDHEIIVTATIDVPDEASLKAILTRIADQEAIRHDRIAEVIESTTLRGFYEVTDTFDFSTDATVAAGRAKAFPAAS
ncbi:hypothetical protein [Bauldia sp.]|uniref:hypothetical protein n=1 Tax=Bauldia sp. TaxID=2575872 RepID=UPI003BAC8ADE